MPGDNDDIPVPGDNEVPEPATILLLGIGSSVLLKRRNRHNMN
ncbi:MAG: PEP-CTERM sorting domain-containing protein [Planctomycetota bacterium]